ncbi:MAG: hypothetical protein JWR89_2320 [Tardiphaga sp.]|jgi:hypothetical protein|uniref:hypothetical protein n=1 Tax=Tardiphaga sp. TaxID=1926292 RepID=UPI002639161C|nr:hypothetical protein [Tardiphaga sp.]MDB5502418.1 hypothetical protein [Tardiphaga sp.]
MTDDTFIDATIDPTHGRAHRAKVTARDTAETRGDINEILGRSVDGLTGALDYARRPGKPLDTVARLTRDAPLGALLVAFLVGAAFARRR